MIENNFYVYIHISKKTDLPFYIGFGQKNRIRIKSKRSKEWNDIVNSEDYYFGYLKSNMSRNDANAYEKLCINTFIKNGFKLVNKINGGSGNSKRKPYSVEYNNELSNRFKKYWENITDIDRKAFGDMMSLLLKGHKKPPRSKEHTEKLKCWSKGSIPWNKDKSNVYSDETKEKMSENNAMSKPILVFDKNDKLLYEFNSISKASRVLSINRTFIYRCLIDIRQCDIYKFKYKEL